MDILYTYTCARWINTDNPSTDVNSCRKHRDSRSYYFRKEGQFKFHTKRYTKY